MNDSKKFRNIIILIIFIIFLIAIILSTIFLRTPLILILLMGINILLVIYLFDLFEKKIFSSNKQIENNLNANIKYALTYSDVGYLIYDKDYKIIYISDLLEKSKVKLKNERILSAFPELKNMLSDNDDEVIILFDNKYYAVKKKPNSRILLFKDISELKNLELKLDDNSLVLGFIDFDNYDELDEYEDDELQTFNLIKQLIYEYLRSFKIVFRQLRNDRIELIMTKKQYLKMYEDKFSILDKVRNEARKNELAISLSIALSSNEDLNLLDDNIYDLMELSKSRGGDQVVIKIGDEEVEYFGGASEAKEKQSKTKVRVIASSLKDLILKSDNIIITGHKDADADSLASCLLMASFASAYNSNTSIILKSGGIEEGLSKVVDKYNEELKNFDFISVNEAKNRLSDNSLVIMCDHHAKEISAAYEILDEAKKVAIIDHHRRKADLNLNTILVYIEASASSASELILEFQPYFKEVEINSLVANLAYMGILIDTNNFKIRTGSRTFAVLSLLRDLGAEPSLCHELLKEDYTLLLEKADLIARAEIENGIAISFDDSDKIYKRVTLARAADDLVASQGVKAAFIIARVSDKLNAISARSNQEVNVQLIMEKLNGGGHLSAAGLQSELSIKQLLDDLKEVLKELNKEE